MTYGCHNHAPRRQGQPVYHSSGLVSWPWRFKDDRQCFYDRQQADPKCAGCRWADEKGQDNA